MCNDVVLGRMMITEEGWMTLPVGILAIRGSRFTPWGLIFARVTTSTIPGVAADPLHPRQSVAGLTAGSVAG